MAQQQAQQQTQQRSTLFTKIYPEWAKTNVLTVFAARNHPYFRQLEEIVELFGPNIDLAKGWADSIKIPMEAQWRLIGPEDDHRHPTIANEDGLAEKLDRVKARLIRQIGLLKAGSTPDVVDSAAFFFTGLVPPFEQLTDNIIFDNDTLPTKSWFRTEAAHCIFAKTSRSELVELRPSRFHQRFGACLNGVELRALGPRWNRTVESPEMMEACSDWAGIFGTEDEAKRHPLRSRVLISALIVIEAQLAAVVDTGVIDPLYYHLWMPNQQWLHENLARYIPAESSTERRGRRSRSEAAHSLSRARPRQSLRHRAIYGV